LRLVPPRLVAPRKARRPRAYGDVLFATTLSALLGFGIVGVLLFNTAMQTQADRIAIMRHRLGALALQLQTAQTALERQESPSELAARAAALQMRPATTMPLLRTSARTPQRLPAPPVAAKAGLSARGRAARTVRGG
jgi:hypothetical protein